MTFTILHFSAVPSCYFACIVDFNKAFDHANYFQLFCMLNCLFIDADVSNAVVKL